MSPEDEVNEIVAAWSVPAESQEEYEEFVREFNGWVDQNFMVEAKA